MKVKWWSYAGMLGSNRDDEIIIDDEEIKKLRVSGATDEEIEEWIEKEVREAVFEYFEWGYEIVK